MIDVWLVLPLWGAAWLGGVGVGYAVRGMVERHKNQQALDEMRHMLKR